MQNPPPITIRIADQADIDTLCASASAGEAAAIDFDGKLVAVANEYGTVTTAPGYEFKVNKLEKLMNLASELWPAPASRQYSPSQERGWVLVERWSETDIVNIHGPYADKPYKDEVHGIVLDLFDSADLVGCKPPQPANPPYYSAADLPDVVQLLAVQLGEPFEL